MVVSETWRKKSAAVVGSAPLALPSSELRTRARKRVSVGRGLL